MNRNLSAKEHRIAELVCEGLSNAEVATAAGIKIGTVKTHMKRIFRKLQIDGRTKLAVWVLKERANEATCS